MSRFRGGAAPLKRSPASRDGLASPSATYPGGWGVPHSLHPWPPLRGVPRPDREDPFVPIRKLDPQSFVRAYNVDLQVLYPWEGVAAPPFGAAWAVLAPGESTKPHAHQECESFFIARGRGVMSIGDERVEVSTGDVTFHDPFDDHRLTNTSSSDDLLFLTVYWEDRTRWKDGEGAAEEEEVGRVKRTMVTAAPPTPNGDLHLGHVAGPYLSADVHARFLRLRGLDAPFACGSDDNSRWVVGKAAERGETPEETAAALTGAIEDSLELAGIEIRFFRPNRSPHHPRLVREIFGRLHEAGHLVEKEVPSAWCPACDVLLFEYRVRGGCGHCGENVTGHTCEVCGWPNTGGDLVEPACTTCGTPAEVRAVRRLVFPVSRFADRLREAWRRIEMPARLRAFCEEVIEEGAPDFPVTQPGEWGIEVPVPGYDDQRINVWFEIGPRYFAYAEHLSGERRAGDDGGDVGEGAAAGWERWWKAPEARVAQFFGYDNSFYYGVLVPALFLAFDPDVRLPAALVTNEFYRLDGQKFSTSRDHRILVRDLVEEVPREAVRWYLAHTCPEREETSFTLAGFRDACRRELLEGWEGWLAGLAARVADGAGGEVPATGDWTGEQRRFYHRLQSLLAEVEDGYGADGFSLQRVTRALSELVREGRRFGRGQVHWRRAAGTKDEERRTGLALELLAAKVLGLAAAPLMPETGERIWRALGYQEGPPPASWARALEWVPAGHRATGLAEPLFPALGEALHRV